MPGPLPYEAWHTFFSLLGAAAATLIGAMFVVVSIGAGLLTRESGAAIRTFLSATIAHLSAVLFGAVLVLVPGLDPAWFAVLVGLGGIAGLIHAARIIVGFAEHSGTDRGDRFWYALLPPVGYLGLLGAAAAAWRGSALSLDLVAAALSLLLAVGIHNAWDMIVFFVVRSKGFDS